jgi:acetyl esterase/lipase
MQRPVMNPTFFDESPAAHPRRRRPLRALAMAIWRCVRFVFKMLTYDPLSRISFRVEEGTPASRFVRGLMYRLAFVPVLLAAAACAIVWAATHPRAANAEVDPASQGIYYEAITFVAPDQVRLEGWLVPLLDAKTVLHEKEQALRKKHPAVVLVHDMGQRREQMLPLIRPLHEAGFIVLAVNLRGGGLHATRGETFGLTEAHDVHAAVEILRRRPFIDPKRVALMGCGTGATAALLAASADREIAAVVADKPLYDTHDLVHNRMAPQQPWLSWIAPLCKWTFEIAYRVKTEDIELTRFRKLFDSRPVLMIDNRNAHADPSDPKTIAQAQSFLSTVMRAKEPALAGAK